jgi:hypothetical protein
MASGRYRRPRHGGDFSYRWSARQAYQHVQQSRRWYCSVSLELGDYLRELSAHSVALRHRATLPIRGFIELLEAPLLRPAPSITSDEPSRAAAPGRTRWDAALQQLLDDLEAMQRAGALEQDGSWLFMCGAEAPSGMHWYNFDIPGFLSCGAAWAFVDSRRVQGSTMTWEQCADFLYMGAIYE